MTGCSWHSNGKCMFENEERLQCEFGMGRLEGRNVEM